MKKQTLTIYQIVSSFKKEMDANPISKIKLTKDFADFTLVSVQGKLKIINEPDQEQFTGWTINLTRLCDSR